jgi:hypothetical protein
VDPLLLIFKVALKAPKVGGENFTLIVQDFPAATDVVQPLATINADVLEPLRATEVRLNAGDPVPEFFTVMVLTALVVPTL